MGTSLCPLLRARNGHLDVDITRRESRSIDFLDDELEIQSEWIESLEQGLPRQAEIEQRADEHIARCTREGVEMKNFTTHLDHPFSD